MIARRLVGAGAESVALSADGRTLAVAAVEAERVTLLDAPTLRVRHSVALPGRSVRVALTSRWALVSLAARNAVAVLNMRNGRVRAVIDVGAYPDGIAVDEDERYAYIATSGGDGVAVVDLARLERIATLPAAGGPSGLLWAPAARGAE